MKTSIRACFKLCLLVFIASNATSFADNQTAHTIDFVCDTTLDNESFEDINLCQDASINPNETTRKKRSSKKVEANNLYGNAQVNITVQDFLVQMIAFRHSKNDLLERLIHSAGQLPTPLLYSEGFHLFGALKDYKASPTKSNSQEVRKRFNRFINIFVQNMSHKDQKKVKKQAHKYINLLLTEGGDGVTIARQSTNTASLIVQGVATVATMVSTGLTFVAKLL